MRKWSGAPATRSRRRMRSAAGESNLLDILGYDLLVCIARHVGASEPSGTCALPPLSFDERQLDKAMKGTSLVPDVMRALRQSWGGG